MKLIDDIRKQSERTRRMLFVFAVAIVVLVAGTVWVRQFRRDLFVLLNPDPADQQAYADAERASRPNPFAFVEKGIDTLRASIGGLFGGSSPEVSVTPTPTVAGEAHLLPLPDRR